MGKSSPPAPDYKGAAQSQADASQDIATQTNWANRPNIDTPWGQQTWNTSKGVDPSTGKPVTQWQSNINLSPEMQQSLDSQQNIQQGRSDAAQKLLGQATNAFDTPFNWGALPQGGQGVQSNAGRFQTNIQGRDLQTSLGSNPFSFGQTPQDQHMQTSLNGNSADYRQRAQDATNALLEPQLRQRREAEEANLSNQGFARDSVGHQNAMREVGDAENRAYLSAIDSGRQESAMMFGQDLNAGQFGNQARTSQNSVDLANAGFQNQNNNQFFQQQLAGANFGNQAQQQQFSQDMMGGQFGNSALQQQLQAGIQAGNYNNQNRQQAISEQQQRRGMSLNELNALLTGQQVSMPNFQNAGAGVGAASGKPADMMGAMQGMYGADMNASNLQNSQTSQMASLGAMAAMMYAFSDARLKEDVKDTGVLLPSGLRVVHYRYRGLPLRHVGVIAQEALGVCPEAVALHPSGYLMVNYSKVH